jgi:hypothetical protein
MMSVLPKITSSLGSLRENQLLQELQDAKRKISHLEEVNKEQGESIQKLQNELENKDHKLQSIDDLRDKEFDHDLQTYYEVRCQNLEKMVLEMHRWFADYDLVFVGEKESEGVEEGFIGTTRELIKEEIGEYQQIFPDIDFDILTSSFPSGDDNAIQSDDLDVLDIFWFANGLKISCYPLMTYDSPWGKQTVEEIEEGFLPSKLQFDFPDGVQLHTRDRRHFVFEEKTKGHPSVKELKSKGLLPSTSHPIKTIQESQHDYRPTLIRSKSHKLNSTDQYLNTVPKTIINKSGDILHPRDDLKKVLIGPARAIRNVPVRVRAYECKNQNQILCFQLSVQNTVGELYTKCEKKLGMKDFQETFEIVSDSTLRKFEMTREELFYDDVIQWTDLTLKIGDAGWEREGQYADVPFREKLVCLHLRRKVK